MQKNKPVQWFLNHSNPGSKYTLYCHMTSLIIHLKGILQYKVEVPQVSTSQVLSEVCFFSFVVQIGVRFASISLVVSQLKCSKGKENC